MSRKNRKKNWIPNRSRKLTLFKLGTIVRVKPGTTDPDYDDLPIGGWTGTIREIDRTESTVFLIEWNDETLNQIPAVYRKRSERDGLDIDGMWLGEDHLTLDTGEPAKFDQPSRLVVRPLSMNDQEDRIRAVFGLTSDDPLPDADEESLRAYQEYLETHLSMPFRADYAGDIGPSGLQRLQVKVTGFVDSDALDIDVGIRCQATGPRWHVDAPLLDLESTSSASNRRLIQDYAYWFENFSANGEGYDEGSDASGGVRVMPLTRIEGDPVDLPASALIQIAVSLGVLGSLLGGLVGSLWLSMETVQIGAIAGAAVLGVIGFLLGRQYHQASDAELGRKPRTLQRGLIGAMVGMASGALIGSLLSAIVGILIGLLIGERVNHWLSGGRRRLTGAVFGAAIGGMSQAFYLHPETAMVGAGYGSVIGGCVGIAVFLTLQGLAMLTRPRTP